MKYKEIEKSHLWSEFAGERKTNMSVINVFIVHSTNLLVFDWTRAQLMKENLLCSMATTRNGSQAR